MAAPVVDNLQEQVPAPPQEPVLDVGPMQEIPASPFNLFGLI
jgi:hypothetical protein